MANEDPRRPDYFLAWATDHPHTGEGMQECARVTAPSVVPFDKIGPDAQQVLECCRFVASETGLKLLFFSELTAALAAEGDSWQTLNVNWEAALANLDTAPIPRLEVSLNYQGWVVMSSPAEEVTVHYDTPVTLDLSKERPKLRSAIEPTIARNWEIYIDSILSKDSSAEDFDDEAEILAFKQRLREYFSDEDLTDFDELIIVPYADGYDSNISTGKTWRVEWLAGPAAWAFRHFDSNILPPGTWATPWDQKELLVIF